MGEDKKIIVVSGKRKTAIAKIRLIEGTGKVYYNRLIIDELDIFHKLALNEPLKIAEQILGKHSFDIFIKTSGGGKESQIQAARLGIAKALIKFSHSAELKKAYMDYDRHLLVADTRRKEACKPDDSKARAKRQSSKR